MPNTATRLITLILLLQRRANQKAAELAKSLGISVRSLHRYIAMLDEMGIPVYSQRGPYGGFSLVRGYKMPPLVFTPEEAVTVYLGASLVEALWGKLYRQAAGSVLAKLDNLLPDQQRQEAAWARGAIFATGMHRAEIDAIAPCLEKLRDALHEQKQVSLLYQGRNRSEPTRRLLDPYALVYRWGWWYLVGYCHLREAVRSFRLDRMLELDLLEAACVIPVDFDLKAYLAQEQAAQPQVSASLRFLPEGARLVHDNRSLWESLEEHEDGSITVQMSAPDLDWAASMALSYGPLVQVIKPEELRQKVREWAQATLKKYENAS
jgi:predicted DNA-binding transcriptional regulator YafY